MWDLKLGMHFNKCSQFQVFSNNTSLPSHDSFFQCLSIPDSASLHFTPLSFPRFHSFELHCQKISKRDTFGGIKKVASFYLRHLCSEGLFNQLNLGIRFTGDIFPPMTSLSSTQGLELMIKCLSPSLFCPKFLLYHSLGPGRKPITHFSSPNKIYS